MNPNWLTQIAVRVKLSHSSWISDGLNVSPRSDRSRGHAGFKPPQTVDDFSPHRSRPALIQSANSYVGDELLDGHDLTAEGR